MVDQMTEPVSNNLLVTTAIQAAIDHAQRYGDRETAADLSCILEGCMKNGVGSAGRLNPFGVMPFVKI